MKRDRPSATALLVAASVLRHGSAQGLGTEAQQLARAGLRLAPWPWPLVARLCRFCAGRWLLDQLEARVLPGLSLHHCRRKAWLHARLRNTSLPPQILWLGVGLDAGFRNLESPECHLLLETDHPATLALRRCASESNAARLLPLQLPEHVPRLLGLCAQAPTLLIAEGLLMYLPARPLLRLLSAMATLPTPPRLLFTALDAVGKGHGFGRDHPAAQRWLARHREPFLWRLPQNRLAQLLAGRGYEVQDSWDGADFGEYAVDAVSRQRSG